MGILDDAIRQHLELIRRHGATDSEVRRLEDEAFGPPTRPDEADFPESEEAPAASGNGVATEPAVEEPESEEEAAAHEDVTTMLPTEERGQPVEQAESQAEEPEPEEEPEEIAQEEPAAEVHPVVDQPVSGLDREASDEPGTPLEEGTTLYDQSSGEEVAFDDLDLTLEDQPAAEPPSEELEAHEPEGAKPLEPPIESLDTVEHPFPEEIVETEVPDEEAPPSEEHPVAEDDEPSEQAAAPHEGEEGEEGEQDEDVLADTPEFLKDAPEDDELWFEQGKPKDFDF
jgi:hypothetical protein